MKYDHKTYLAQIGLKTLGFDPGPADGLDGENTQKAFEKSLSARFGSKEEAIKADGSRPPRPKGTALDKSRIFGAAGNPPMDLFKPPYPMTYEGKRVKSIGCHKLIKAPLEAALRDIAKKGEAWIKRYGLDIYAGCFNHRRSRGGSSLSDHSWAIAIDLNPSANANKQTWRPGRKHTNGTYEMPKEAVRIFQKHGFQVGFLQSGGTRRDMMHIAYVDRP